MSASSDVFHYLLITDSSYTDILFLPCFPDSLLFWLDSIFCFGVAMKNIHWSKVGTAPLSGIPPGEWGDALQGSILLWLPPWSRCCVCLACFQGKWPRISQLVCKIFHCFWVKSSAVLQWIIPKYMQDIVCKYGMIEASIQVGTSHGLSIRGAVHFLALSDNEGAWGWPGAHKWQDE